MKTEDQKIKDLFCAKCQEVTPHSMDLDQNGDYLFTCQAKDCDRFVKFHGELTPEEVAQRMADHEENNKGQLSLEKQFEKLDALHTLELPQQSEQPVEPEQSKVE